MPFGISDKFETFGSFQKNQKEKPKQPLKSKMIALTTTNQISVINKFVS